MEKDTWEEGDIVTLSDLRVCGGDVRFDEVEILGTFGVPAELLGLPAPLGEDS